MTGSLRIEIKRTFSWETFDCNDCNETANIKVTFPKFDMIYVCDCCYKAYYKDQVDRNGYRKGK